MYVCVSAHEGQKGHGPLRDSYRHLWATWGCKLCSLVEQLVLPNHWASSPAANSCILSAPTSEMFPEPWSRADICVPVRSEHSIVSSLHFAQSWVSELLSQKKEVKTESSVVCWCKHKYLRGSLTAQPVSKILVAPYPLGRITSRVIGFGQVDSIRSESFPVELAQIQSGNGWLSP